VWRITAVAHLRQFLVPLRLFPGPIEDVGQEGGGELGDWRGVVGPRRSVFSWLWQRPLSQRGGTVLPVKAGRGNRFGKDDRAQGKTVINPLLGVLSDNGGPTWTSPLLPGSPALDGGVDADCPPTDQRGFFRVDGRCDAGAYEAGAVLFVPTQWVYLPLAMR
jgi:hypothetical protein